MDTSPTIPMMTTSLARLNHEGLDSGCGHTCDLLDFEFGHLCDLDPSLTNWTPAMVTSMPLSTPVFVTSMTRWTSITFTSFSITTCMRALAMGASWTVAALFLTPARPLVASSF
ncbi:hypothetical protein PoB_001158600 [Plakobranchus ocellatus]|uniref:Uncharacterized protein n=1 Tax=Plakobranchus ocellatus TaxID=259542 RepID=A0AAV3YP79_9GAST|nr:hypothetical protein PoB_001158600 [Plakobranchus ocellatus]